MTTYFVVMILCFIVSIFVPEKQYIKRSSRYYFPVFIVMMILSVTAGLRFGVGTDYSNYWKLHSDYVSNWLTYVKEFNEPGLPVIAKLGSLIKDDYVSMFFLTSLITVSLYVMFLYSICDSFWLGILLYILTAEWQHSFNGMRQYLAAAVLLIGYKFILEKKFLWYLIVVAIACCFHTTALVMLPLYFIVNKRFTFSSVVLFILVALAIRYSYDFLFGFLLATRENFWMSDYVIEGVKWQRVAVSFAPLIFIPFMPAKFKNNKLTTFLINMCVFNAVFMFAAQNSKYLARVSYYTQIYVCAAIPRFLDIFEQNSKRFLIFVIVICYFLFWWIETNQEPFVWIFSR